LEVNSSKQTTMFAKLFIVTTAISLLAYSGNTNITIKKKKKARVAKNKEAKPYYDPTITLMVDKSDYELKVYDAEGWLATYPVVFGNKNLGDKKMEGDRNTPEGTFRITWKNPNHKWNKFVQFDYPTADSYQKFKQRKANGEIPADAKIGGSLGIHGTWPSSEHVVDNYINWTEGCISMRNEDLDELYAMLPIHTKIQIKR
jgi:murein L,D-transpeptidase YafK